MLEPNRSSVEGRDLTVPRSPAAVQDISCALTSLVADLFTLYVKTINFQWHVSGPHFEQRHHMFQTHGIQTHKSLGLIAERTRLIGGRTIRSVNEIITARQLKDAGENLGSPGDMVRELLADNVQLAKRLREIHDICEVHGDLATSGLIETLLGEAEARIWFLTETSQDGDAEKSGA